MDILKKYKTYIDEPFSIFYLSHQDKKFLFILMAMGLLYVLPFILSDVLFLDDYGRAVEGYTWNDNGRPFQTLFYRILSPNILNISPFTQILGMVFLVFSCFLIYKKLFYKIPLIFAVIISFFFIANPFFLENLSYKYDSIGMCLAVMLSVLGFYFGTIKNFFLATIFVALSMLTYQSVFLITAGLSSFYFIKISLKPDTNYKNNIFWLVKMVLVVIGGYILYSLISAPFFEGYVAKTYTINKSLASIQKSLTSYLVMMKYFFRTNIYVIWFFIPFVLASIQHIIYSYESFKNASTKNVYKLISYVIIFSFPILIIVISSLNLVLISNQTSPRTYTGFSLILLFTFLNFYYFWARLKLKGLTFLFIYPALTLMILSFSYANMQQSGVKDADFILNSIFDDLKSMDKMNKPIVFIASGDAQISPETEIIQMNLPIKIGIGFWADGFLRRFAKSFMVVYLDILHSCLLEEQRFLKIIDNNLYTMKVQDTIIFIEFKKENIKRFL